MGSLLQQLGRLDEAEPLFREAMESRRRMLGEEHPSTLISINNMGTLLYRQRKLSEAEPYFREAMRKSASLVGEDHPNTVASINNLGVLLSDMGESAEAELYLRDGLERRRRILGEEHPDTIESVGNLGALLQDVGRYQEAIDLLSGAEAATRRASAGNNALQLASSLSTLGRARVGLGYHAERFALAESNLLEAHAIYLAATDRGPTHTDTIESVQGLVELYNAWHAAEPEKGFDAKASEWRAKLDAVGGDG
jgi:tetratricopeptide (TPR) repeat protein